MASSQEVLAETSLKGPAMEIVDLTSEDSIKHAIDIPALGQERDPLQELSGISDESDEEWENESLYEDALDGEGDEGVQSRGIYISMKPFMLHDVQRANRHQVIDACTLEEALAFRKRLRLVGEDQFVIETIEAETITAKKLCTAFGIRPPSFLECQPDSAYYPLLGLGITRELEKRVKLPQYNSIDDAVALLKKSKNIIVLTGAGISTSLGIPDFRSKNTGLYSQLAYLGLSDPQEVFDIHLFREDPSIFYSVAKDILPTTNRFSPTHGFIRLLQDKDKLLTNFTQNIDNLEGYAGISAEKLIQCHGSFATASCQACKYKVKGEEIYKELKAGKVAHCGRCIRRLQRPENPAGMKRKRSSNGKSHSKPRRKGDYDDDSSEEYDFDIAAAGVMKPDITFFGEGLPAGFHQRLVEHDKDLVDLVIVIGTSLKVAPVSEVVGFLPAHVPQMFISRDPCLHVDFDIEMLGDCDVVVAELCKRAGWTLEHDMIPSKQEVDVQLADGYESRYTFKITAA